MFSSRNAGHSSPVIIIDDDSESTEHSTPVIIIDDDPIIENSAGDLHSKSRDCHLDFKARFQMSVTARKKLMSLLRQGYEYNEAKTLVSTPSEEVRKKFERACLDDSVPNAPKWPIPGVLPASNSLNSEIFPNIENFSNIPNERISLKANETNNLGESKIESFYSSFEDHIQNIYSHGRVPSPILLQHEKSNWTKASVLETKVHIKAGYKRHWTAEPEGVQPKAKRFKASSNNMQRRKYPDYIDSNFIGIEVGIVPAIQSEENFSVQQFKALQETILEKVLTIKHNDIKPSFFRSYITTNELVITCCNEDTVDWLEAVVNDIKEWNGVDLQVVHRKRFPRLNYVIGYFPNSHGMSYKTILNFIDAQNHGFNIAKWKILTKTERTGNASFVKFSMDDDSLETLRENEWKIYFQLKRIKLKLIRRRRMKVSQF